MRDFTKLKVWAKSHELVLSVYQVSQSFPKEELYALTSQVRRASASIPSNIAEGCGRGGEVEFAHFLRIAFGSASELEYELLLSRDLGYLAPSDHSRLHAQVIEVKQMHSGLIQKLKADR